MLISSPVGGPPRLLAGLGATPTNDAGLQKLQAALIGLANATANAAINPGVQDGALVNGLPPDRTMAAIAAAMALITPHLPTWAGVALSVGFGVGATTTTAKQAVLDYSGPLRDAVIAATATAPYYNSTTAPGATAPIPAIVPVPWYTTWWGIGAIAVGVIGAFSLLSQHRAMQPAA